MSEFGDGLPAGARIEEFEIVRELGRGGFGITYLARDHALARLVAVKEYLPQDWGTRQGDGTIGPRSSTSATDYTWGLKRFVDEARVLARLNHPGIVSVYRILEAAGTAYMAMEYVEGHSLAEELRSSGPLPERRVREVLGGLAGGLAQVHAAGLLHRDIKPANVMLRAGDGSPVLIDFGAARQQMGRQSRSITAVLTPGYAPIEQYSPKGRQGPWTDVYALGAVAYAALSGQVPDDATERTMGDALKPVESIAASPVGPALGRAVAAALAMNPKDRPQDMAEWLTLLGGVGDVPATGGRGATPLLDSPKPSRPSAGRSHFDPDPGHSDSVAPASAQRHRSGAGVGRKRRLWLGVGGAAVAVLLVWLLPRSTGDGEDVATPPDPDSVAAVVEAALELEPSEVRLIQRGLLEAGFDPVEGDGLIGAGTREAVRRLQASRGLEATGFLGANLADVLMESGREAERAESAQRMAEERAQAEATRLAEARRAGRTFRDCGECPLMVVVPSGSFRMGSPGSEAGRAGDEGPVHSVRIGQPLAVGAYEVTFGEWDACVAAGGCGGYRPDDRGWGRGTRPVIDVSWEDARTYAQWLSRETGEGYRLLSEAEWEYSARAGTETARHWGEGESGQCGYANGYDEVAHDELERENRTPASCRDGYVNTAPVGTFGANGFGLYDMLGNVWEWTEDCVHEGYGGAPGDGSAWLSGGDCSRRVLRGGSWYDPPRNLRSANRYRDQAGLRGNLLGFRVARTIN